MLAVCPRLTYILNAAFDWFKMRALKEVLGCQASQGACFKCEFKIGQLAVGECKVKGRGTADMSKIWAVYGFSSPSWLGSKEMWLYGRHLRGLRAVSGAGWSCSVSGWPREI